MRLTGRNEVMSRIETTGLVAVIRSDPSTGGVDGLVNTCRALAEGGANVAEITMTSPGALEAIKRASEELGDDCVIGVGSVLDPETARAAILAGAHFVFCPTLNVEVIRMAHRYDKACVPGAMTPTEILTAWESGADLVKVFPANHFGPSYFKDVLAPLPQVKLTPTGGVNLDTAAEWLNCGAACLGVGSAMVKKDMIKAKDWAGLSALAAKFAAIVKETRGV